MAGHRGQGKDAIFDVAVGGAGVAGLGCAAALASAGLHVLVCERAAHGGGRAASWPDGQTGMRVDIGPHVVTSDTETFWRCSTVPARCIRSSGSPSR